MIVVIGVTGAGKSTYLNYVTKSFNFKSSDSFDGCTKVCESYHYEGEIYVDTPGIMDTNVDSVKIIKEFLINLNCVVQIIVLHPSDQRIYESLKSTIKRVLPEFYISGVTKRDKGESMFKSIVDEYKAGDAQSQLIYGRYFHTSTLKNHWEKKTETSWVNYGKTYYSDDEISSILRIPRTIFPSSFNNPCNLKKGFWDDNHEDFTKEFSISELLTIKIEGKSRRIADLLATRYYRELKCIKLDYY